MITGSHNPAEQNGLKIVLDRQTLAAGRIAEIRDQAAAGNFSSGNGRITQEDIVPAYLRQGSAMILPSLRPLQLSSMRAMALPARSRRNCFKGSAARLYG